MPDNVSPALLPDELSDYRASPLLQFGNDIHLKGDPETAENFARALAYLEAITDYFLEFGLLRHTLADVAYELAYHNDRHRTKVEQAELSGQPIEYQEITLANLRALSKRRLLAMDETGWNLTHFYRPAGVIDHLIEKASAAEAAMQALNGLQQETQPARPVDFSRLK